MANFKSIDAYQKALDRRIRDIESNTEPLKKGSFRAHGLQTIRIFTGGQRSSGGLIGQYSDAYKRIRRKKQLKTDKVTLTFTNKMRNDFTASFQPQGKGFITGISRGFNVKKLNKLSEQYGSDVFKLTKTERAKMNQTVTKELIKLLTK